MISRAMFRLSSRTIAMIAAAGIALPAQASEIEEIVVSARKRDESMQDVPIALSAISEAQLQQSFLVDSTGLAQFAPNVVFDSVETGTAGGGGFSIRGISYQDVEKAFDPTVLVMVDEIAVGTGTGNVMNLLDVERIEVLRGPQGTLFGKNAVGGIINIHRKKPKFDSLNGKVRAGFGNHGTNNLEGYFNYGVENFAIKLNAARIDHDGYFKNPTLGGDEGDRTENSFGVAVLWQAHDTLTVGLKGGYTKIDGSPAPSLNISSRDLSAPAGDRMCFVNRLCAPAEGLSISGDRRTTLGGRPTYLWLKEKSFTGDLNWELTEDYKLTYLYGWIDIEDDIAIDSDGSPQAVYSVVKPTTYEQQSHELRLSHDSDIFSWQIGGYFWDMDAFNEQLTEPLPFRSTQRYWAGSKSYSVFGESDFRFASRFVLTTGFRYIEEKKSFTKEVTNAAGVYTVPPGSGGKRKDDDIIWRLGLRYELSDDVMAYFTYSTGFRSGGFSPRATTAEVLATGQAPEKLTNYELGWKSRWLDGRLQLNGAVFHMIYDDMQIETSIPGGPTGQQQAVANVGKAEINGLELDVVALLTDQWTLSGNLGVLDSEYKEFFTDLYSTRTPADFTFLDLRRAPKLTYAIASTYRFQVPTGNVALRASYDWRDDYEGTLNNHPGTQIKSFGMLNASIVYDHGDNWSVSVFGNNLTNEDSFTHTFVVAPTPQGGSFWKFANPRAPRTYGMEVVYRFGE